MAMYFVVPASCSVSAFAITCCRLYMYGVACVGAWYSCSVGVL